MRREIQQELVDRVERYRREGESDQSPHPLELSAAHYVGEDQAARELRVRFQRAPQLIALTPDLPDPGDYLSAEAAGTSLLIVRDDDGNARAFVNACRHRGARIAEGRGNARVFTCPFHAWTWNRNGSLAGRPSAESFEAVSAKCDQLWERPCHEVAGMIFVLLEGDRLEEKVAELLGDSLDDIEGYAVDRTQYFETATTTRDCNYKFIVDGFGESYHIASLHKDSISTWYYSDVILADQMGRTTRNIGIRRSIEDEFAKPASDRRLLPHATTQYIMPPNVILTHQVDHIQLWRVHPEGADRCRVELSLYWPEPVDEEALRKCRFNLDTIWNVTCEEDFPQSVAIHRNLASGAAPNVFIGRNEPALVYWHEQLMRDLEEF